MRIAILADPLDNQNAGIHVFTREMIKALIKSNPGHEIILIREKKDPHLSGVKQISLWNTRLPVGYASLRLFITIPLLLHNLNVDAVIEPAHFGPFNLLPKVKRITIIHDLTPIIFPHLHRWHSQFLQKVFLKRILRKTDVIIANSDNTRNDICKHYPDNCNKVVRLYPGISDRFSPVSSPEILKKYGISEPYFLFVGTIEPRKNLTTLLKAFSLFKAALNSNYKLVLAGGNGWKVESFYEELSTHKYKDQIILTGFVDDDDLPALYSSAYIFIYPSLYEGFGLPIAEAMKCGVPVITTRNSSLPEAGGDGALYFETSDPSDLCDKMKLLCTNQIVYNELKQKARLNADRFSWDKFAVEAWKILAS